MADKLIRELVIEVTQKGSDKAQVTIKRLASSLEDAAAGAELASNEFKKMERNLTAMDAAAKQASSSLQGLNNLQGVTSTTRAINSLHETMKLMSMDFNQFRVDLSAMMNTMDKNASKSFGNLEAAVDKVGDNILTTNQNLKGFRDSAESSAANADRFTRALGDTSGSARGATRDFAALSQVTGKLPMLYGMIASNVFVLGTALNQAMKGDQLIRLAEVGVAMGAQTGTPIQLMANALLDATKNAISFEEAMRKSSKAASYGYTIDQIRELGVVANRASNAGLASMDDALNRALEGVANLDMASLKGIGITTRLTDAYSRFAQEMNALNPGMQLNSQNLTAAQKKQAYFNAVVLESEKNLGKLDDALSSSEWATFNANIDSSKSKLQQGMAEGLRPWMETINRVMYTSKSSKLVDDLNSLAKAIPDSTDISSSMSLLVNLNKQSEGLASNYAKSEAELDKLVKRRLELHASMGSDNDYGLDVIAQVATNLGASPLAFGFADTIDEITQVNNKISAMNTELAKSGDITEVNRKVLQQYWDTMIKGDEEYQIFSKYVTQWGNIFDMSQGQAILAVDWVGAEKAANSLQSVNQFAKKSSLDIKEMMTDLGNMNNVRQAALGYAEAMTIAKNASEATGLSMDFFVSKLNMGVSSMKQLEEISKNLNNMQALGNAAAYDDMMIAKGKLDIMKRTGDFRQANAFALKEQAAAAKAWADYHRDMAASMEEGSSNHRAEMDKAYQYETQYYNLMASGLNKEQTKTKEKNKQFLVEEQIALLNNRSLNSQDYAVAAAQLELDIAKAQVAYYSKKADKQNEFNQALIATAKAQRTLADLMYAQTHKNNMEQLQFESSLRDVQSWGKVESINNDITDLVRERAAIEADARAAGVAADESRIKALDREMEVLTAKREMEEQSKVRGYQDATSGLLGGTYSSTAGMSPEQSQAQEFMNNQQGWADAMSNLRSINAEATDVATSLGNVMQAVMQYSEGALDATSTAAAGMQMISSMFAFSSKQQTSSIDAAIKAEQARDGKSEESKAKLKKLETEKIKIQQEAAKKQILIQTAMAVMQAATSVPYPWSIPLMVAAAAAGAMSYAQASNPTSPSLGGGDAGASYLKLGDRNNSIDVAKNATGGELSYLRGEQGSGSAQNFIPRAEGGVTLPGVGYMFGENGVELRTESSAGRVIPNDKLGDSRTNSITMHVTTMDSASFHDYLVNNRESVQSALEAALNERGSTLQRL